MEENNGPVTRKRRKVNTQNVKDQEQLARWVQPVVVIGPNDIVLHPYLQKVKVEQEEWDVKPEVSVQVQVNEETLGVDEDDIDLEEGVLVVKEEVAIPLHTTEEDEVDQDVSVQVNEDFEEHLVENEKVVEVEIIEEEGNDEIQNTTDEDVEVMMKNKHFENMLEENRLLKTKLEERETTVLELDKLLQEKQTERKTLEKEVQVLEETDSSQQVRIKMLQKMVAGLDVEDEENEKEVQNVEIQTQNVQNLPSANSVPEIDKMLTLFPEVIELIHKKEQSRKKYKKKLLRRADFLNCRLVCSAWKDAIDEIKAGPCHSLQAKLTVFYNKYINWEYGQFDPQAGSCINQKRTTAPQFNLSIVYSDPSKVVKEEIDNLTKLLKRVGETVKEFTFYKCSGIQHEDKLLKRYIRVLNFMPNLTKVHYKNYRVKQLRTGLYISCRKKGETKKMPKFPNLPKLRHLSDRDLPHGLFEAALAANPQLTSLELSVLDFEDLIPHHVIELTLHYSKSLNELSKLKLPFLEKLTLRKGIRNNNKSYDDDEEESYSGKFKERRGTLFDSLKILELCFNKDDNQVFLKMHHLHSLIVNFDSIDSYKCNQEERILDFVDQFTSVENLILKGFVGCNCNRNRCSGYQNKTPLKTDMRYTKMKTKLVNYLWAMLPKLKKVEISLATETRKVIPFEFVFLRKVTID